MIDSKEQYRSFVKAIYRFLQANGLPADVSLSTVREQVARFIANKPSNRLDAPILVSPPSRAEDDYKDTPTGSATLLKIANLGSGL